MGRHATGPATLKCRARAFTLEALVAKAGFKNIQIEAGQVGLVVYGSTQTSVAQVAAKMAEFARLFDSAARAEAVCVDASEASTSRFIATVRFDWNALSKEAA
jgi:histidine ammonia-lyase